MEELSPEAAEAVHKAKSAAQAVEFAREAQGRDQAEMNRQALLAALKEVFGDGDQNKDPKEMRVLVQRIPILCTSIISMHDDISELKDGQKWAIRLILGGIVTIISAVVISMILK